MAGILANSVDVTHTSAVNGETKDGYVSKNQIVLSTNPTGTNYSWGLAVPNGSAIADSELNSTTAASPVFTPDVEGPYVVTCTVDSTTSYTIQLTVAAATIAYAVGGIRLLPVADASIPTPSSGRTLYNSSTQDSLAFKEPDGSVHTIDSTSV